MSLETETPSAPATPAVASVAAPVAAAPAAVPIAGPPVYGEPVRTAPVQPQTVTIPLEQLQTFTSVQARLAQMEADQRARDAATTAEHVKLLAAKGEIEKALLTQREDGQKNLDAERAIRAALEVRAKRYALDGEVSRVLASQPLVPGGAEQLTQLWRDQFVVEPQGDSFQVRTPAFQSVGDFVKANLARPEYAHFIRASNPGGGTAGAISSAASDAPTAPANPAVAPQPKNFGEAIIMQMEQIQRGQPVDARRNTAVAMGLNSRSMVKQA
jgi:hypothetical protein